MKRFLAIVLCVLIGAQVKSQVLVVNVTLGECVKCAGALSYLQSRKSEIPAYLVFESKYIERSAELAEMYHFTERRLIPVFNDSLKARFPSVQNMSTVYLVVGDSVIYRKPLVQIDQSSVSEIEAIEKSKEFPIAKADETVKIVGNNLFAHNYVFNELTRRTPFDTFRYLLRISEIEGIYRRQKCFANDNLDDIKSLVKANPEFKPVWSSFGFTPDKKIIALGRWFIPIPNTHMLNQRYGLFCFKNDKLEFSHLIYSDPKDSSWTLDNNLVYPISDEEIILSYFPSKVVSDSLAKQKYMAVFRLSDGCYKYAHHLNPCLTKVYRNCVGHNGIGYFAMDERFVCLSATNEVQDYRNPGSYLIPLEKIAKPVECSNSNRRKVLEQIFNFSLGHTDNELFLLTRINGVKYCIVYDRNKRDMTNAIEYSRVFPATKVGANFLINAQNNSVTIPDELTGKCRVYPLALIYSKANQITEQ